MKKKPMLIGFVAVVVGVLGYYAQDLLDLYRLQSYISESTETYQANGGPWPHLSDVCSNCHGADGNSLNQRYPSLAGQPAPYLAAQLQHFASGERRYPNMEPLAKILTQKEIDLLASHYAKLPVRANATFLPYASVRERGRQVVAGGGCVACHGENLMGNAQFPRIAAQGHDYLLTQLEAFASGQRNEPTGAMKTIATSLSKEDRKAVAAYLASLEPKLK